MKNLRNSNGLTLVELIVAIAIASIIMLAIATIFTSTLRSYTKTEEMLDLQTELQLAIDKVQEVVREADSIVGTSTEENLPYTLLDKPVGSVAATLNTISLNTTNNTLTITGAGGVLATYENVTDLVIARQQPTDAELEDATLKDATVVSIRIAGRVNQTEKVLDAVVGLRNKR